MSRSLMRTLVFFGVLFFFSACKQENSRTQDNNPKTKDIKVADGFNIEHLYSPKEHDQGSWVAMTVDDKGRLITCDQYGHLYRITVPPVGFDTSKEQVKVEELPLKIQNDTSKAAVEIGYAHGLLYAFNSLYITVNDEGDDESRTRRSGLYRLQDTDGDDIYDKLTLLKELDGRGEHGPHAPVLGPDGKSIYLIAGNFTKLPPMDNYRLPNTWQPDNLLPLLLDPNGFGNFIPPPGGWIARTDSVGSTWELVAAGFRNPFDMEFNEDGELFTFDSDMEWDFGLPWYRPIRICHVTNGAEFGYRENNGKFDPAYPDNLPAILNVGQGSPTNVMSGKNAKFPEKYRKGIFTFDWTFGIIYHFELQPDGSSYSAKSEEFVSGSPLPLTDGIIGADGAMYFLTGGRRIESDLYRVYYGDNKLKIKPLKDNISDDRNIRHQLESYQVNKSGDIDFVWDNLDNSDRFIRYAARLALEHMPAADWAERGLKESNPVKLTNAMLGLARSGDKSYLDRIVIALSNVNYDVLSDPRKLDYLRTMEVTLARMEEPDDHIKTLLAEKLNDKYPASSNGINRELSKVLGFVGAPNFVEKTVALIATSVDEDNDSLAMESTDLILRNQQYGFDLAKTLANKPPAQQIYLANVLAPISEGWNANDREGYFKSIYKFLTRRGGNSYTGFIAEIRKMALNNVPKAEYEHYNIASGDSLLNNRGRLRSSFGRAMGPGRDWKVDEAVATVEIDTASKNFQNGQRLYKVTMCSDCHSIGGDGGSIGPDLTQLSTRFSDRDILEAIISPSKEISDQYAATHFSLNNGTTVIGRLIRQDNDKYYISQNPFDPLTLREVAKKDVASTKLSDVSIMPPGLINSLNPTELQDLIYYIKSGGNEHK